MSGNGNRFPPATARVPSIGLIVLFRDDVTSRHVTTTVIRPAIVTLVLGDTSVDLYVFGNTPMLITTAELGDGDQQWQYLPEQP